MKKNTGLSISSFLCLLLLFSGCRCVFAQEPEKQQSIKTTSHESQGSANNELYKSLDEKSSQLDLKLQLLDTKLDLLDSKIKLWEAKPEELDIRLNEIDARMDDLEFEPAELNRQFIRIDSLIEELKSNQAAFITSRTGLSQSGISQSGISQPDLLYTEAGIEPEFRSAIMLDPVRLFEGTFCLSYERLITDKFSVGISGLATYATKEGMTNYFLKNQELAYYDELTETYIDYQGEAIAGGGVILQCRDYLLADFQSKKRPPLGLYAAPQLLYRRLLITGEQMELVDDEWVEKVIKQRLNILSAGAIIGVRVPLKKVMFLDFFLGGHIRFSKYDGEAGLTKYKDWYNIDFSGVFPTAGIGIGILK